LLGFELSALIDFDAIYPCVIVQLKDFSGLTSYFKHSFAQAMFYCIFNSDYALEIDAQHNFSTILDARRNFGLKKIASYFETQNLSIGLD
jgi:hypothetical protein